MQKIVIDCGVGFGLSPEAFKYYAELKGEPFFVFRSYFDDNNKLVTVKSSYEELLEFEKKEQPRSLWEFWKVAEIPKRMSSDAWMKLSRTDRIIENQRFQSLIWDANGIERNDPDLIKTIEVLGDKANDEHSRLKIVEIPDNVEWYIETFEQGGECIHEKHRSWM